MRPVYAKNDEMAINYLMSEYGFKKGKFGLESDEYELEASSQECGCGETDGYTVSDKDFNVIERIAVCEACYNEGGANRL